MPPSERVSISISCDSGDLAMSGGFNLVQSSSVSAVPFNLEISEPDQADRASWNYGGFNIGNENLETNWSVV